MIKKLKKNNKLFNKSYSGSITIEMSMLFPIIILVIFTMMILVFYVNDIICIRASAYKYGILSSTDEKSEDEISKEFMNNIKSEVIIAKIKNIEIEMDNDRTKIKTTIGFELPVFNIVKSDSISVTMYNKDNRKYVVRTKVAMDIVSSRGN